MPDEYRISTAGIAIRDGKVFIALRKPGTTIGESWEFPGGKAEEGETYEQTLKREYREEFDTDINVGELLCEGSFKNGEKLYKLVGYQIFFKNDHLILREHSKIRWAAFEELAGLPMAVSDRQIADCILSKFSLKN